MKYRPKCFSDVIGQSTIVEILKSIVERRLFESAYMFSGPSGVGKTTVGRIFSNAILCDSLRDGEPCGDCESCREFQEEKHFGYKELDAASFGGKDDMVKLRDDASFQSIENKKIILIDECHDISKSGQDALLKQVEQCPDHLIYLFCTTEPEKMAPTLKKRCMNFQFSKVTSDLVLERLNKICVNEGFSFDEQALSSLVYRTSGHVRDAINLLEETSYLGNITLENLNRVSMNFDEQICSMICFLGQDLKSAITLCREIVSHVSTSEMYSALITLLSDAAGLIYGREDYPPARKELLFRLRDTHGYTLLEFLKYLIDRDRYIDRVGVESDIIILHYKYCANSFKPQLPDPEPQTFPEHKEQPLSPSKESTPSVLPHDQLLKMSPLERNRFLREQRRNQKGNRFKEDPQRIPTQWSLPKEEKLGSDSDDDSDLDPVEFSRLLRGGRGCVQL